MLSIGSSIVIYDAVGECEEIDLDRVGWSRR